MSSCRFVFKASVCGLIGGLLMLTGDFLFCGALTSGAEFHSRTVMATRPDWMLVLGGSLGPIAGILYCLGMTLFYFLLKPAGERLAAAAAALLGVTMLVGGSYHAVFTTFGFAAKVSDLATRARLLDQVGMLFAALSNVAVVLGSMGTLLVFYLVLRGRSHFPRWLLIFMPTLIQLASSVFRPAFNRLPSPLGSMFLAGWINGSFVLFFALATFAFWPRDGQSFPMPARYAVPETGAN
jgi:hypothetical protein